MQELDNIGVAVDEQQVGRNGGFGIPMYLADYTAGSRKKRDRPLALVDFLSFFLPGLYVLFIYDCNI